MPITVDFPTSNQSFGFNHYYQANVTDVPGDATLVVSMFDDLNREVIRSVNSQGQGVGPRTGFLGELYAPGFGVNWIQTNWLTGNSAFARFQMFAPSGQLYTSISVPVLWENVEGTLFRQQTVASSAGGFTTADRQVLNDVLAALTVSIPASAQVGDIVQATIGQLWNLVPGGALRPGATHILTGRGSLPESGPPLNPFFLGATWQFFTVPEHYGVHPGVMDQYEQRLMQLSLVAPDSDGNLYIREARDFDSAGWYWVWGLPSVPRIDFDVAPGVAVSLQLLSIGLLPTPHPAAMK